MSKPAKSFQISEIGLPELSRFPLHIGLEIIRRLHQKEQNDAKQSPKALSSIAKNAASNAS